MKFGKLTDISKVDFSLAVDNQQIKVDKVSNKETEFFVGATGWSMKEWIGRLYPPKTKAKDFLWHYSRQFNTIELNTTHYRIPTEDTIKHWHEQSAADFHFCPKIPQTISHSADLGFNSQEISLFCKRIIALDEKLGCCFIQLPPYFDHSRLPLLENFLKRFPSEIPLAVELRHESWFSSDSEDWVNLLQQYKRCAVITDVAGRRDVLHMKRSNNTTMIRFVGNDLHQTDYQRSLDWAKRLKNWSTDGLEKAYVFTHEPDNLLAPEMAEIFVKDLNEELGIKVRGPVFREETEGKQMSLFQ